MAKTKMTPNATGEVVKMSQRHSPPPFCYSNSRGAGVSPNLDTKGCTSRIDSRSLGLNRHVQFLLATRLASLSKNESTGLMTVSNHARTIRGPTSTRFLREVPLFIDSVLLPSVVTP